MTRRVKDGWDKLDDAADKGPFSFGARIILIVFGLAVFAGVIAFVANPFTQAARIVNKTIDADNVIYNYEWFKLRHEGILAIDNKITTATADVNSFEESMGPRKEWGREDKIEHSRLKSIASGLQMQRDDLAGRTSGPAEDGSYGSNGDAIFFFATDGTYLEWNGRYHLSDKPLKLTQPPMVTMEAEK